jgi:hypothetical protein
MKKRWRKHGDGLGRVFFCLMICWLLLGAPLAFSQNEHDAEYKLKLAFLYNFAQFVEWPPDAFRVPNAPLTVCVVGENPFQGQLEQSLRDRKAGSHPIELKNLMPGDDPKACHLIFLRAGEKKAAGQMLTGLKGSSALTVGESKGFAQRGGVINLTLEENKLGFEINVDAAGQSHLRISAKLLALAKIVK